MIERYKPYKRGCEELWILHQLDITDKHSLILTAMASVESIRTSFPVGPPYTKPNLPGLTWSLYQHFLWPLPKPNCTEHGGILFMRPPEAPQTHNYEAFMDVAVREPGVVECEPIVPLAEKLVNFVEGIIHSFDPLFV